MPSFIKYILPFIGILGLTHPAPLNEKISSPSRRATVDSYNPFPVGRSQAVTINALEDGAVVTVSLFYKQSIDSTGTVVNSLVSFTNGLDQLRTRTLSLDFKDLNGGITFSSELNGPCSANSMRMQSDTLDSGAFTLEDASYDANPNTGYRKVRFMVQCINCASTPLALPPNSTAIAKFYQVSFYPSDGSFGLQCPGPVPSYSIRFPYHPSLQNNTIKSNAIYFDFKTAADGTEGPISSEISVVYN
ncbi:hypothetical protein AA313_de0200572 [Arthrobotrys entomopaga]|nr:hypothetical protein AA313_de0200572 [Arthrobotrys entomopaga]